MTTPDLHLDTGVLALDAMPADEAPGALSHALSCESCSPELVGFRETAALLGSAAAEAPPASLRRSIMARIAVTPQLPPVTGRPATQVAPAKPDRDRAAPTPAATPAEVSATPAEVSATPPDSPTQPDSATPTESARPAAPSADTVIPLRRWYRRPSALVAAAVAALVIGGGSVVAVRAISGPAEQTAQTPEECVAQAPDREQLTPAKGQGTATYSQSCNAVLLDVTGLPAVPADKTYQLWAIANNQPRSLGELPDAAAGKPQVVTARPNAGETVLAITAEPAGGSPKPTTDILWQATLAS